MDLEWREFFKIGIDFIDDDHKNLLEIIRDTKAAINDNDMKRCSTLLAKLLVEAKGHFTREETYLEKIGYPSVEGHRYYHNELLKKADTTRRICEGIEDEHDLEECFDGMVEFLVDDILVGDLGFKSFLQDEGLIPPNTGL